MHEWRLPWKEKVQLCSIIGKSFTPTTIIKVQTQFPHFDQFRYIEIIHVKASKYIL
ncbi:hypothetical protein QG37_03129 [Candidozyma auris]|nr:hypothetical protein QG37_03129 [[Candida] auris]